MTQVEAERLLTVEEFYRLPDPPPGGKMELVRGKVVTSMPLSGSHGRRAVRISRQLLDFAETHNLGEVMVESGFLLGSHPDVVRAPDVSFLAYDMQPPGGLPEDGWIPAVPTLAVEIVSPSETFDTIQDKLDDYREAGVPRVWIVRPCRQSVTVYRDGSLIQVFRSGDALTSDDAGFSVPGFSLEVDVMVA